MGRFLEATDDRIPSDVTHEERHALIVELCALAEISPAWTS
jgi:hypothetical protein